MNAGTFLSKVAAQRPEHLAIRFGDLEWTYREFADRCLAFGGALRARGLKQGDRIAIVMRNRPEMLESIFGGFMAGLVVVPINARLHPAEIAYIANDSGARALLHSEDFNEDLEAVAGQMGSVEHQISTVPSHGEIGYEDLLLGDPLSHPVDLTPDDLAWLFYTSGTTGKPKGVIWTHRIVKIIVMNYLSDIYNMQPEDVVLHAAPLSHGSGVVALPSISKGATNVISQSASFDPQEIFELIGRFGVTNIAFLAPTQIVKMLSEYEPGDNDLQSLKCICYGGAPMYVEDLKRALDAFGPVFAQIYGQGEAPLTITFLRREDHTILLKENEARLGSAGIARTDVEVAIADDDNRKLSPHEIGEIIVRGEIVMLGYWNNAEATAETIRKGWLRTGDIGMMDENGYLFILDRSKDLIISGGNNIYPREVEETLLTHSDILEVAVVGVPDDYWGESVHAIVVARDGSRISEHDVIEFCGARLARYKKPRSVEFVTSLPKNAYGKIMKRELREKYWTGYDRRVGGGLRAADQ